MAEVDIPIIKIVAILFSGGLYGGFIRYFRNDRNKLLESIVYGLGSALMLPVFLSILSSDLMKTAKSNYEDMFVLLGLATLVSTFSDKFIDSMFKKINEMIRTTNERVDVAEQVAIDTKNKIDPIIIKSSETQKNEINEKVREDLDLSDDRVSLLKKIKNSKYTYRSVSGLSSELGLSEEETSVLLEELLSKGFVGKTGGNKWFLTSQGAFVAELEGEGGR
ncbi:YEATS-associated helix-containing protein [Geothermobacter hydrogeniphilus]|uniref:YEATS-Like-Associating Three TM domain-containing protein n=1 Tax=Geothermobacter hydrogeniphilus TaxID=1969733 RepID=A0A1X0Y0D3_9BACT|nr:YEATS-associated helix-containing protein [Geothermobacter hydrogeniphilus]ORJ58613.1 hypothetical protein B5V00_12250 [Geothermobacter hydrogeniphilus]